MKKQEPKFKIGDLYQWKDTKSYFIIKSLNKIHSSIYNEITITYLVNKEVKGWKDKITWSKLTIIDFGIKIPKKQIKRIKLFYT